MNRLRATVTVAFGSGAPQRRHWHGQATVIQRSPKRAVQLAEAQAAARCGVGAAHTSIIRDAQVQRAR
jgi:hypothetical protein